MLPHKNDPRLPNPEDDICIHCNLTLLMFRSYFYKVCIKCGQEYDWPLNYKQQPLIKHQR